MKVSSFILVVLAAALGLAPSAMAEPAAQRTDPQATSPAGVIYEIPVDSGRRDGAPHRQAGGSSGGGSSTGIGSGGGTGGGGATGGGPTGSGGGGAAGTGGAGTGGTGAGASGSRPGGASAEDPSSIHSENGFGSSSQVPGTQQALDAAALRAAREGDVSGSPTGTYLLLALIAGAAVYVGIAATGAARRP